MSKKADKYFGIHPWQIIETGFDPEHGEVAESIFSLGNEYMGLRGYFEEGYSGAHLQGSYIGGVYERRMLGRGGYKGTLPFTEFMVNTVDWVYTRIECNGVKLDLNTVSFGAFERVLDLRTGVLARSFVWQVDTRTSVKLTFERFLSMPNPHLGAQRVHIEAMQGTADIKLWAGLDFSPNHQMTGTNHFACSGETAKDNACQILGTTQNTAQPVFAAVHFSGLGGTGEVRPKYAGMYYACKVDAGQAIALERLVNIVCGRDFETQLDFKAACEQATALAASLDYDSLKKESAKWWAQQWEASDIKIVGDEEDQQGIRYGIFQLHQTLHTADRSAIIGAKGLTGEAYNGNAFWDSETYCLPFYLFSNPKAARNILQFRYDTLPQAKQRAKALDQDGAFYPIATISGHECCDLWQHANLQLQASTAVTYGLWHYVKVTGDNDFLYDKGAVILVEVCRMLSTRGAYSARSGKYGYYGVMGPDEFQMMVNHNAYTNLMAKHTFEYALQVIGELRDSGRLSALLAQTGLQEHECEDWQRKAECMYIPYDEAGLVFEQHEGFFDLPHVDISEIPITDFPLYSHWAYDRIYRNDMIKQPDVMMFMLLFMSSFTKEQLKANYDYYTPRCIHESSLSPSVHSIIASQLGRMEDAYRFFGFATRLDLDNYNRNTHEGLHTTALAASWMNIVYGFGGLRSDGDGLSLWPCIPPMWQSYHFTIQYRGAVLRLEVMAHAVHIKADTDDGPTLTLYGDVVKPTRDGLVVAMKQRD